MLTHIVERAATIRPGRMTTIAATLTLILSAGASSVPDPVTVTGPASPGRAPVPGPIAYGNDISWPQCPKGGGGYGLPGPMASASFAVLGLTDGGSFRANPCLADQVASVKVRHLWVSAYAIHTYPTPAELTRYGGAGTLAVQLGRVGAAQAAFNLTTLARVSLKSPMVWVDIEPRTPSPWSASTVNNNAVIDGVLARYKEAGIHAGLYSYDKAWKAITGGRVLKGVGTWVPVGHKGQSVAKATCALASYAGSKPWLTQWTDDVRDYNLTCPGVTGRAASGNVLTPFLNVLLASGSRGDAVAVLQRQLGAATADGVFGPTTRARVVAFQRTRQMKVDGIVGPAVWRALGAGTGTYSPALRGFMSDLFAPT